MLKAGDEVSDYLGDVRAIVEANSFETMCLWEKWTARGKSWNSTGHGYGPTVGKCGDMPVCISILTVTVDGVKVLFVDPISQVVDHRLVEEWLKENVPTALRRDGYLNKTDAMNFCSALSTAQEMVT